MFHWSDLEGIISPPGCYCSVEEISRTFPPDSFISGIRATQSRKKLAPTTRKMTSQSQPGNTTMEDLLKGILDQQATMNRLMIEQEQSLNQQLSAQNSTFEQMLAQMRDLGSKSGKTPVISPRSVEGGDESGFIDEFEMPKKVKESEPTGKTSMAFNSRIEFPPFDGTNPRSWLKKCSKYFSLCRTPIDQRVELASLYMVGKAELWYNGYAMNRSHVIWEEFVVDV